MLSLEHVNKSFGAKHVLKDLTFNVQPGQMFGFCGANAAGKTTTMRIILGLLRADSGNVTWRNKPIDLAVRTHIGYMPEERGLYPKMKPVEQLTFLAELHGLTHAQAKQNAEYWVDRLGVKYEPKDTVEKLSLGNQQKVQLAAALVSDPEILILDEPFSGLDPVAVDSLTEALQEKARAGVPVVFSSHQLELVERLCQAVGIISEGSMVAVGSVDDLRQREHHKALEATVAGVAPGWSAQIPGATSLWEQGDQALLSPADPDGSQAVLAALMRIGPVEHFGWKKPTLAEIFREAVAPKPEEAAA